MVDVALEVQPRGPRSGPTSSRARRRAGRLRAGDRPPGRQRRRPGAAGAAGRAAAGDAVAGRAAAPSANPRAAGRRPGCSSARHASRVIVTPPLGYFELDRAAVQRPRGADRLGRAPEGGLPGRRAVHHAAPEHRVDRDGRAGLERARRPRSPTRRSTRSSASRPPSARRCTATATRANASSRRLHCASHERRRRDEQRAAAAHRRRRARLLGPEPGAQLRGDPGLRAGLVLRRLGGRARAGGRAGSRARASPPTSTSCWRTPRSTRSRSRRPVPTHAELAVSVLEAGKHCFVEKPLAQSVADAERAVAAAHAAGRVLMVGHLLEYHPGVREAQGAGRLRRARRADLLHLRQPPQPRQAARRRERALEPRGARRLGRAAPGRRGAVRRSSRTASPTSARASRTSSSASCASRPGCPRTCICPGSTRTRSGASRSSARDGWRPSTTWRSRAS